MQYIYDMLMAEGEDIMIEIIYKDETGESKEQNSTFYIPRNIRQIGLGGGKYRIYIED